MTSRRCPKCGTVYGGDARFCAKDGSPLVDVAVAGSSGTTIRKAYKPPNSERFTLSSQRIDNRYEVVKRLGEGGMSYVYEAKDLTRGETIAIKILSPKLSADTSSVQRLRREAGLAMRLEHPHVCKILRLGETEDELLSDREGKAGPLPIPQSVEWLGQMCSGLHHAHQLHIVHRDLKPENVMIIPGPDDREIAVVMDFGLAKENRADPSMAKLTATGIILGTPEFMSPEQIRGRPIDARSDVYALAIVAFEMFTSKLPFAGRSAQEMMIARLRGKPATVRQYRPEFPAQLEAVLMRAMAVEPDQRYGTALEFGKALVEAAGDAEVTRRVAALLK
jgi:serine/threonine-protein kinase